MLTLRDVLGIPEVRRGDPVVVAGDTQLDRTVEWVHTTELIDIQGLIREGDLVLTTGIAMPEDTAALAEFGRSLAAVRAAGLIVELGRRWNGAPPALVAACEEHGLPLVELHREVRFAAVTQAVCEQLVESHVSELREHQRIDAIFTELSLAEAAPEEILAAVQRLAASCVVLESDTHEILLVHEGSQSSDSFLGDWGRRSRSSTLDGRTAWDECNGWLVTRIGRPDRPWGRLVLESPHPPGPREFLIAERGAAALTLRSVQGADRTSQLRRRHREAITALMSGAHTPEANRRVVELGFPTHAVGYVGLALAPRSPSHTVPARAPVLDDIVKAALRAAERVDVPILVAAFEGHVKALLPVDQRCATDDLVDQLHARISDRFAVFTAAGSAVGELPRCGRTLQEAAHVLSGVRPDAHVGVHRLASMRVRGLLSLLQGDDRLHTFALRQLAPLESPDGRRDNELLRTLEVLLEEWGSKSAAASRLTISRSVLYERIARIERLISEKLDDPEVRTSLHLALLYLGLAEDHRAPLAAPA